MYKTLLTGPLDSLFTGISKCSSSSGGRSFKQPDKDELRFLIRGYTQLNTNGVYDDHQEQKQKLIVIGPMLIIINDIP